jgi:putative methyltransferase (TIGR04325 family)
LNLRCLRHHEQEQLMGVFDLMHRAIDGVRDSPLLRPLRRAALDRQFANNTESNLFHGIFDSFEAAAASAPATRPLGYDNADSAAMYQRRLGLDQYDYPALFWIERAVNEGMTRIADLGGSVGIKYYAFGKFIRFPERLVWRVIDVPAVVEHGRAFAVSHSAGESLEFSDSLADIDGMDVLFASGALQYIPEVLPEILARLAHKPRRIVVNTTPIHPHRSFVTLNSIGTAYCPYRVQSYGDFAGGVRACGYQLRDQWSNTGKRLRLPLDKECSLDDYSGFCFDLA